MVLCTEVEEQKVFFFFLFLCLILVLGVLAALDGFMNVAMEQCEEFVGGQLKNRYADAFIRGNK